MKRELKYGPYTTFVLNLPGRAGERMFGPIFRERVVPGGDTQSCPLIGIQVASGRRGNVAERTKDVSSKLDALRRGKRV